MPAGYLEDLAYIHDAGFSGFALQSAPGLLDLLRRHGIRSGLVVDLGCGSGLWARELVRLGFEVFGADYSPALLKMARQRVPEARFKRASFLDVELPPCVAVTALGEIFNYQFDEKNCFSTLTQFFGRVYHALLPGGVFIFDVAGPGRAGGPGKRQRHAQGDDWATLVEAEEDATTSILTRHITSFRRAGKLFRRSEEVHRLRLYRGEEVAEPLRRLGFRVRLLRRYGDFRFPRGWIGVFARKLKT